MRSLRENLRPSNSEVNTVGQGLRFSHSNETVKAIKSFFVWQSNNKNIKMVFNYFLLCFNKPIIGPWALWKNNSLQFSDNWPIRGRIVSYSITLPHVGLLLIEMNLSETVEACLSTVKIVLSS